MGLPLIPTDWHRLPTSTLAEIVDSLADPTSPDALAILAEIARRTA